MNEVKTQTKKNMTWLPKTLYIIAAVIAVIFVYMIIVNVMYIKNYLASYGMTFSDMMMDSVQYVITGSISYLVYAILVFCAGKIISMLQTCCPDGMACCVEEAPVDVIEDDAEAEEPIPEEEEAEEDVTTEEAEETVEEEETEEVETDEPADDDEEAEAADDNEAEAAAEEAEEPVERAEEEQEEAAEEKTAEETEEK